MMNCIVSVSFGTSALFKWKGESCPGNDETSCWLGHGDLLVMDGQSDPGSDQERINVTFRWEDPHVASCSFLSTGVRGFFCSWYGVGGERRFWGFLASPWCLVHLGSAGFAGHLPCVYKALVSKMCLLLDPPLGRRSVEALSLLCLVSLLCSTKHCLSNW